MRLTYTDGTRTITIQAKGHHPRLLRQAQATAQALLATPTPPPATPTPEATPTFGFSLNGTALSAGTEHSAPYEYVRPHDTEAGT